ncbi:hypothetical protein HZH66_014143 [Vespula vulgaris]|uniref:Uncharacterized protein n=1 Tax=Vespula vulgaris TaxID=7454 RepID=A0A834J3A8_VESVU|nr:hypothetical protein HZH66_014143 [Vespula vulgaris]
MPLSTLNMRNILNGVVKVGMWMKMRQEGIDYKAESSSRALPLVGPEEEEEEDDEEKDEKKEEKGEEVPLNVE